MIGKAVVAMSTEPVQSGPGLSKEPPTETNGNGGGGELEGLAKWIKQYHDARPGLEVLQAQIDQWMAEFDVREEQARREREAKAAEDDGWTLVVGKAGRKKNTDAEGTAVGAVAPEVAARAAEEQARKKNKGQVLDFYRFQERDRRRSELMALQQKFDEDKKRIARLKASRKFRPY
ncbi:ribosomal RNA-processing protein 7 [Klebsormidium nitens]|uniref:Ribosomal RNA-processing protein 7 n=1 Tax=Klebsormidium nitens TaxID=105231 RepID=A0A0U9HIK0_KLENI|nr:ribosomal RNA-processing protein 7 [Klebsormidium nitens]|eukprot:GAQ80219.1 ribosomal RNA-processing protein 7 [Klebsormidium nitens]